MYQSDVAPLRRVLMKHPRDAFVGPERLAAQWRDLNYLEMPDFDGACREADEFAALLEGFGAVVEWLSPSDVGCDSLYARDASFVFDGGAVIARMGKEARASEPPTHQAEFAELGVHVAGVIEAPGIFEGGDATWLSPTVLAVGEGYRTNGAGIDQLESLMPEEVEVVRVPMPHGNGPADVLHLMSALSPLSEDVLLVYSRLLPVVFRQSLLERGFRLVEVPDEEFGSQGPNVLAVAPGVVIAVDGNPVTRSRMEEAGVEVHPVTAREICVKGCGGPTCLTRTLERAV